MCGIFGSIAKNSINEVLCGIKKLEYRGYDSAGLAFIGDDVRYDNRVQKYDGICVIKSKGEISKLGEFIKEIGPKSNVAIAHTRWATHGQPNIKNCHPHVSADGKWAIVHNGIIENFEQLKSFIDCKKLKSDTDSEIVAHLLEKFFNGDVLDTVKNVCGMIKGSYALAIITSHQPNKIFVAKRNSPVVLGKNKTSTFVCSDVNGLGKAKEAYLLKDNQFAVLEEGKIYFYDQNLKKIKIQSIAGRLGEQEAKLGRYKHFMLKEIDEEPLALKRTLEELDCIKKIRKLLPFKIVRSAKKIIFVGCGTAYHAALIGQMLFEKNGFDARCEIASEFVSKVPSQKHTLAIFISQSGETADTLKAVEVCKQKGLTTLAITNVKNSSITFKADRVIYTNAGVEIGVASTKAYCCQVEIMYLLAAYFLSVKEKNFNIYDNEAENLKEIIEFSPQKLKPLCKKVADQILHSKGIFIIGRGMDYLVAQEASLKLKEITYLNCQAYPAGELKHGTISLIDKETFVFAISSQEAFKDKIFGNICEVVSRQGKVIVMSQFNISQKGLFRYIKLPQMQEKYSPLYLIVYFQLLAYYTSKKLGLNPDKPRSLAKSVTVE